MTVVTSQQDHKRYMITAKLQICEKELKEVKINERNSLIYKRFGGTCL